MECASKVLSARLFSCLLLLPTLLNICFFFLLYVYALDNLSGHTSFHFLNWIHKFHIPLSVFGGTFINWSRFRWHALASILTAVFLTAFAWTLSYTNILNEYGYWCELHMPGVPMHREGFFLVWGVVSCGVIFALGFSWIYLNSARTR